jgi:hypothetical protein
LKIPITKKAGEMALGEGSEFKPQYYKGRKEGRRERDRRKKKRGASVLVHACNSSYLGSGGRRIMI